MSKFLTNISYPKHSEKDCPDLKLSMASHRIVVCCLVLSCLPLYCTEFYCISLVLCSDLLNRYVFFVLCLLCCVD